MHKFLILVAITCIGLLACVKEEPIADKYVTLSYNQTFCSDPWGNHQNDSLNLEKLGSYLDSLGLYASAVVIRQENVPDMCFACFCKTGKVIYVTTFDNVSIKAKYQQIGFQ